MLSPELAYAPWRHDGPDAARLQRACRALLPSFRARTAKEGSKRKLKQAAPKSLLIDPNFISFVGKIDAPLPSCYRHAYMNVMGLKHPADNGCCQDEALEGSRPDARSASTMSDFSRQPFGLNERVGESVESIDSSAVDQSAQGTPTHAHAHRVAHNQPPHQPPQLPNAHLIEPIAFFLPCTIP